MELDSELNSRRPSRSWQIVDCSRARSARRRGVTGRIVVYSVSTDKAAAREGGGWCRGRSNRKGPS